MWRRALWLELRARTRRLGDGRGVDVLVTHSPPLGLGDDPGDPAHRGFAAFNRLASALSPKVLVHGHIHPFGRDLPDRRVGGTLVVNAVGYRLLEIEP